MPKRSDTVFTQRTVSRDFLFVNFLENPLAKSIAKRIVLIFKHAVVFLYIFTESKVAVTVQLYKLNSFLKIASHKDFQKSVADSKYITTPYAFYTRRCILVHFRRE